MKNITGTALRVLIVAASFLSADVAMAADGINISCGDSVKSLNKTATMNFSVTCPVNCAAMGGSVWGTDLYTTDSSICRAAVHAGVVGNNGGPAVVTLAAGQGAYSGIVRNGVTSSAWGAYDQSFKVAAPAASGPVNISCGDSIKSLNKTATMNFSVTCPVNCVTSGGSVWGTDLYTTDSSICRAAIHAGVVTNSGGSASITLAPGQGAYTGTPRNGITTTAWGAYDQSFKVSK
jgi:hypothetical protein